MSKKNYFEDSMSKKFYFIFHKIVFFGGKKNDFEIFNLFENFNIINVEAPKVV
jgi:hypothetical protein